MLSCQFGISCVAYSQSPASLGHMAIWEEVENIEILKSGRESRGIGRYVVVEEGETCGCMVTGERDEVNLLIKPESTTLSSY